MIISNIYVAAVVGAGFATGQEIYSFFSKYGVYGFFGVCVSTAMFCVIGSVILNKVLKYDVTTPDELAKLRFGDKGSKFIKIISVFLQFSVFIVMLSGLRTILYKVGIPDIIGSLIITCGLFFIISSDIKRIIRFNTLVTPIVIIGITAACIIILSRSNIFNLSQPENNFIQTGAEYKWFISALLYGFFNSLLVMPALCSWGGMLNSSKKAAAGGTLGGLIIGGMAFLSNLVLFSNSKFIGDSDMPVIDLASRHIDYFGNVYQIVIFAAMAGSAVICGKCTIELFSKGLNNKKTSGILRSFVLCLAALPLSMLDFSGLIGVLYPFFGAVGIIAVGLILW